MLSAGFFTISTELLSMNCPSSSRSWEKKPDLGSSQGLHWGVGELASWPLSPSDFQKSWSLVWSINSTQVPRDKEEVYLSKHILHNREYLSERCDTHLYASSSLVLVSGLLVLWSFLSVGNFNFPSIELLNLSSRGISAGDTLELSR